MIDYTYETNRFRMPLLKIVGVTSTDMTFFVCFVYLQVKCEKNYAWALGVLHSIIGDGILLGVIVIDRELSLIKAINSVFPAATNLLCKWHINRNVLVKLKKLFETKEKWDMFNMSRINMLVSSSTYEEFGEQLYKLNQEFNIYLDALKYVKCSWLEAYKEKFISPWTDKCIYFWNTTKNRYPDYLLKL